MNILIVNTLYYPYRVGGAEKSVQLLAESLVNKGHAVTIATLSESKEIVETYHNGVRIVGFPLRNIYWFLKKDAGKFQKTLWHFLDINNLKMKKHIAEYFFDDYFDVVHTNNLSGFSTAVWDWCYSKKIPIVHTARDYYLLHPNTTLFSKNKNISPDCYGGKVFSFLKKIKSNKVTAFISISNYVNDIHVSHGYFRNAVKHTIYNSVDNQFEKSNDDIDDKRIIFGFLGRIEESKGIELLLQQFAKLNTNNFLLKIGGDGNDTYVSNLKTIYGEDNIKFEGKVDIKNFFPTIDYLVVPSLWNEPMGRVVIESYSHGRPVIGSSRGGIKEIITNGETGYLFDPDTNDSLDTIFASLDDRYSQSYQLLSENALNYSKDFNTDTMVSEYLKFYKLSVNN